MVLLVASKGILIQVPYFFKELIDQMGGEQAATALAAASPETVMVTAVPMACVMGCVRGVFLHFIDARCEYLRIHFSLLLDSFQVWHFTSNGKRLQRSPKRHFFDCDVASVHDIGDTSV